MVLNHACLSCATLIHVVVTVMYSCRGAYLSKLSRCQATNPSPALHACTCPAYTICTVARCAKYTRLTTTHLYHHSFLTSPLPISIHSKQPAYNVHTTSRPLSITSTPKLSPKISLTIQHHSSLTINYKSYTIKHPIPIIRSQISDPRSPPPNTTPNQFTSHLRPSLQFIAS
ncbi:hypothetical protein EJ05DRAFT_472832 [Pseudovirgaria hyperparasitica]|uniref:Uncharacterized protein n=1 Tax=Pseudovirgaria hyperparasitica TaxID=470096 RepID=A0A6A6WIL6_9PEZI|nr:uncharacterized protein EJ05DRAFT_472832 [Pseudovirgaria hyperparasitica]KAF2761876.1 hypothetical protein EJ05DRAFT_472832 [Pseudovirgaria hyperparasitica]